MSSFDDYKHKKFDRLRDSAMRSGQGGPEEHTKSSHGKENMPRAVGRYEAAVATVAAAPSSSRRVNEESFAREYNTSRTATDNRGGSTIVTRRMALQKRKQAK